MWWLGHPSDVSISLDMVAKWCHYGGGMGRQLRRVPIDFDWPINKVWTGYLNPHCVDCSACGGRGATTASERLSDLVSLLLLSGADAATGRCHPYLSHDAPLNRTAGVVPSADMTELTAGLAGRRPSALGHDCCDKWTATKKIIAAAGLPGTWGRCMDCDGSGIAADHREAYDAWQPTDPPTGDAYQMWETVSEGSPISPPFATPHGLAEFLAKTYPNDGTSSQWIAMIEGDGWIPSMVIIDGMTHTGAAIAKAKGAE